MSCEDSLSQSMLATEVVKDRPFFSNLDVSSLLDEIEALQKGLEAYVSKKGKIYKCFNYALFHTKCLFGVTKKYCSIELSCRKF